MEQIELSKLKLDTSNPRFEQVNSQNDAIQKIFELEKSNMIRIAKDIHENGLDPTQGFWVLPEDDRYIVLEGNRRLASILCLIDPARAPEEFRGEFERICVKGLGNIPKDVNCQIVKKRDDAKRWIGLRHTGANNGVGISPWFPEQQARFESIGEYPDKTLQLIEWLKINAPKAHESYQMKPMFTNLERLVSDPYFRKESGLELNDGKLSSTVDGSALAKVWSKIVSEFASTRTVDSIKTKEQRKQYVEHLKDVLPSSEDKLPMAKPLTVVHATRQAPTRQAKVVNKPKKQATLVTKSTFPFSCSNNRIMAMVGELKRLKVEDNPNACSMLLRGLIEMATYLYAKKQGVTGMQIARGKFADDWDKVIAHMEQNNELQKSELKAVRKLAKSGEEHLLSYDTLHQCVHNKDFFPAAQDIFRIWYNVEPYLLAIGKKGV